MMITQRQFHFSWVTGTALMIGGTALAATGSADWGLFWVGGLITGLALSARMRTVTAGEPQRISSLPLILRPEA